MYGTISVQQLISGVDAEVHLNRNDQCSHSILMIFETRNIVKLYIFVVPSWPIQRSAEDQKRDVPDKARGYILEDLLEFIPYSRLVPDDLHLRIRISLKLFNQVIKTRKYC